MRIASLLALLFLATGCGLWEEDKESAPNFTDQADVICSDAEHQISLVARPQNPQDPLQIALFLERALPIAREQLTELQKLSRPPEQAQQINALLAALDAEVKASERMLRAARRQDGAGVQRELVQTGIASAQSKRLADELDLAVCGGS